MMIFFYGHSKSNGENACFSQFFKSEFVDETGQVFNYAEQYMMYNKAITFSDTEIAKNILLESKPSNIKKYGRQVKNFDSKVWDRVKFDIVVKGNYLKFSQNDKLRDILISTGDSILVEASPTDKIWGIGMSQRDPLRHDVKNWKGQNLLGKALMKVRDMLLNSWEQILKKWKLGQSLPFTDRNCFYEASPILLNQQDLGQYERNYIAIDTTLKRDVDTKTFKVSKTRCKAIKSLSGDTWLVIPPSKGDFSTLYDFCKNADSDMVNTFWKYVSDTIDSIIKGDREWVGDKIYVSTHGLGVNWLHVRLSPTPKYYVSSFY